MSVEAVIVPLAIAPKLRAIVGADVFVGSRTRMLVVALPAFPLPLIMSYISDI